MNVYLFCVIIQLENDKTVLTLVEQLRCRPRPKTWWRRVPSLKKACQWFSVPSVPIQSLSHPRLYFRNCNESPVAFVLFLFRYFRARRALDFRKYNQNSCPRNNPLQHLHATFYPRENTHTPLTPTSHSAAQITLEHNGNQQVSCHTADLVLSSKISRRTSTQSLQLPHKIKGCLCSHKRKESRLVQLWSYRL